MYGKFQTRLDAFCRSYVHPSNFFLKILFLVPKVSNSWIFQKRCFMKIIWHRIFIQTLLFQACLPNRQNGVGNLDKAYWYGPRCFSFTFVKLRETPWISSYPIAFPQSRKDEQRYAKDFGLTREMNYSCGFCFPRDCTAWRIFPKERRGGWSSCKLTPFSITYEHFSKR